RLQLDLIPSEDGDTAAALQGIVVSLRSIGLGEEALVNLQTSEGLGEAFDVEWEGTVPYEIRNRMSEREQSRQSVMFEIIKGELQYYNDLVTLYTVRAFDGVSDAPLALTFLKNYRVPLQQSTGVIPDWFGRDHFCHSVFHNAEVLMNISKRLVDQLVMYQTVKHPQLPTIMPILMNIIASSEFRTASIMYISNYPLAQYFADQEAKDNGTFRAFREVRFTFSFGSELTATATY
ncbi:hypothetical protein DXG01_014388, partial [Tephrocybe rancida]